MLLRLPSPIQSYCPHSQFPFGFSPHSFASCTSSSQAKALHPCWCTILTHALLSPNDSTALHFRNTGSYFVLQICTQPPSPSSVSLPSCGFSDIQSLYKATYSNGMCQGNITVVASSQLRACSLQIEPKPYTRISEMCSSLIRNHAVQYQLSSC